MRSSTSLLHHQKDRARRLPSPRDGCRVLQLCVHHGVHKAVLASRVPAPQGSVCWGRDSACSGSSPQRCGDKLWEKGVTLAGQGPSAVQRVQRGSGCSDSVHVCRGLF